MKNRKGFLILCLFLVAFGVYANSLASGFVWDDQKLIIGKQAFFNEPADALRILAMPDCALGGHAPYYRPLNTLTYMLDHYLWGLNPFWYHLENVLLHALAVLLFYLLLAEVFEDRMLAFFAALLFAVYPVNAEAVDAVFNRNTLLCAVFCLASLLCLKKGFSYLGRRWTAAALFAYFLALMSKEQAVVVPFFLLTMALAQRGSGSKADENRNGKKDMEGKKKKKNKEGVIALAGFFAVLGLYFLLRHLVLGTFTAPQGISLGIRRLKFVSAALFEDFKILSFPFQLNAWRTHTEIAFGIFKMLSAMAGGGLLLYLGASRRSPLAVRAGAQWTLWALLPVSNIVRIPSAPVAERFLYMASPGFILIAGYLLWLLYRKNAAAGLAALIVVSLIFGARTFMRNPVWKTSASLYASMLGADPQNPHAHYNMGVVYLKSGDYKDGVSQLRTALQLDPSYVDARIDLAYAYRQTGRTDEANGEETAAARTYFEKGADRERKGDFMGAAKALGKAVSLDPGLMAARIDLGVAYAREGELGRAEREFKTAVWLSPGLAVAHLFLAIAYEKDGRIQDAVRQFQKVLRLDPGNGMAMDHLKALERKNPVFAGSAISKR